MSYRVRLFAFEEATEGQRRQAEQRFCGALNEALGDESLVGPVYAVYQKIAAVHGDSPSPGALSPEELEIVTQWQAAESAALTAALGPNRYMGDAEFEIRL